ncbi:MAG: hypothetical protein M3R47_04040 [Chloroflexota bacterium]|nr:hypothetical protein [Chloroflexota bacterium]
MYLLFEEQDYPIEVFQRLRLREFYRQASPTTARFNYIGFFKSFEKDTSVSVFTLPKIFLHDGKVFGKYDLLAFATKPSRHVLNPREYDIIRGLIEKLYFCLRQYQKETNSDSIESAFGYSIKSNIGNNDVGSFEAMLGLIAFNRSNPYLLVQHKEISISQNPKYTNWKKTLSTSLPINYNNSPLYLDLSGGIRKNKRTDPLLMIYYSLLNEFKQYDPTINIDASVDILPSGKLSRLKTKITLFLRTSKSLYFSDKFKQLHSLLYSYYFANKANYKNERIEFLLTDDFDRVFEKIVDTLLSDEYLLAQYKYLKDGKEIDHLFGEADVFRGNKIIYIGDSKYYKDPRRITFQRYKQFTYARNIIQENIYVLNSGGETIYSRNYRDDVSEGYNVTPNFFVIGTVNPNYLENGWLIEPDKLPPEFSFHFPNRLFDRDTLHVLYFNADFIRLVNFYIGKQKRLTFGRQTLRDRARETIQKQFSSYLENKYDFYELNISAQFVENNFRILHGKVFTSPALFPRYLMALERRFQDENNSVLKLLHDSRVDFKPIQLQSFSI